MKNMLSILSIGSTDPRNTVRDVLLQRGRCHLSVAANYRDLFAIPRHKSFEVAILHQILSSLEFRASNEYIRRTWPFAKVLVICTQEEVPDDPLYDEWLAPDFSQEMLIASIERLALESRSSKRRVLSDQQKRG
jgi:hypothetical protein